MAKATERGGVTAADVLLTPHPKDKGEGAITGMDIYFIYAHILYIMTYYMPYIII